MMRSKKETLRRFLACCLILSLLTIMLPYQQTFSSEPPSPPDPIMPPLPPADNDPGVDPTPPPLILPDDVIYNDAPPTGMVTFTETDPETGESISYEVAHDEIIVEFSPQATEEEIDQVLASINGYRKIYMPWLDIWLIGIPPVSSGEELKAKLDQLESFDLVEIAEAVPLGEPLTSIEPNDSLFKLQDNLERIYMPYAWQTERGDPQNVWIGVIDSGVRKTHQDIEPKLAHNLVPPGESYHDEHGTEVASVAAAATNNEVGIAGVGWDIMLVSGMGTKRFEVGWRLGTAYYPPRIAGRIKDMIQLGKVRVINMSFFIIGGDITGVFGGGYKAQRAAYEAWKRGILMVAAAGNDGKERLRWPASDFTVIAVGGMGWDKNKIAPDADEEDFVYFRHRESNYKLGLSVVAPYTADAATVTSDSAYSFDVLGTSFSAPHVAGLAALLFSHFQSMTHLDVRYRIEDTADDRVRPNQNNENFPANEQPIPGYDRYTGWGRIDARRALQLQDSYEITLNTNQWHLICLPIWPKRIEGVTKWQESAAAVTVFPIVPGLQRDLYRLVPGTEQYALLQPRDVYVPDVDLVRPYHGFWVRYHSGSMPFITVTVTGAKAGLKPGHDLEIQLHRGLNMLGNPFTTPLPWDDNHVRVRIHWISKKWFGLKKRVKYKIVPLSQAIAEGWLKDTITLWNPNANEYYYVDDNVGQSVPVGQGFWLAANRDNLTLLVRP